jgi:hypothetical protein
MIWTFFVLRDCSLFFVFCLFLTMQAENVELKSLMQDHYLSHMIETSSGIRTSKFIATLTGTGDAT